MFINCPFDRGYRALFRATVFGLVDCGFVPRCSLEISNAGQPRIEKILDLIAACPLAVHDISRTELDRDNNLPRFNMPFELGIFIGAQHFDTRTDDRSCIVFDKEPYRYQKFLSDISGQDVTSHDGNPTMLIGALRDWLSDANNRSGRLLPSGEHIRDRYRKFRRELPAICARLNLVPDKVTFVDLTNCIEEWLKADRGAAAT